MAQPADNKTCGACGKPVSAIDIMCPHCHALLAAYEAPSGSDAGSAAALTPVDMSSPPPESLPTSTTSSGTTITATSQANQDIGPLAEASPIAQATKETRIADGQTDASRSDPVSDSSKTIKISTTSTPVARPADRQRAHDRESLRSVARTPTQTAVPGRTKSPDPRQQAPVHEEALDARLLETATPSTDAAPPKKRSDRFWIVTVLAAVVIIRILAGIIGWPSLIVVLVVLAVLIQWMRQLARSTGRKSTKMPRDPQSRR